MILPEESYKIMGACFTVHNTMGSGFVEDVYQECLALKFLHLGIPFTEKPKTRLRYRDRPLRKAFRPDFLCFDSILLELKAVSAITDRHRGQVINYLNATKFQLGILINFGGHPKLEWQRFAFTEAGVRQSPIQNS